MRVYKLDENNVEVEVVPWQTNTDITQRGYAGVTLYNTDTTATGITAISADNTLAASATHVRYPDPRAASQALHRQTHRDGKRGCFWKRGNHACDNGNWDVLPVFSDDCKRHNFDNLHLYAGRVRVGEHQHHERRRP